MTENAKKLLIITQKVDKNDIALGFFLNWIKEFNKYFDKVTIICLYEGQHDLSNQVITLGKKNSTKNASFVNRLKYVLKLWKLSIKLSNQYDAVFVHMNPIWVVVCGLLWRLLGKKITLWYAHGAISFRLRVADLFANIAFTSTSEGYRLPSRKKHIVGQGIDVIAFAPSSKLKALSTRFTIISVGRITPSKDYETLIQAIDILKTSGKTLPIVKIVGDLGRDSDKMYKITIEDLIKEKDLQNVIHFVGPVTNYELPAVLQEANLFVNMGQTGSLDKAGLEAMAVGLPILTCNEAYYDVLENYAQDLMFEKENFSQLSKKIESMINMDKQKRNELGKSLRDIVVRDHTIKSLIKNIFYVIQK